MALPAEVAKVMPRRGNLQQYRLASAVHFVCARCGQEKVSKLVTVVDGDDGQLICNGCYGKLLSL